MTGPIKLDRYLRLEVRQDVADGAGGFAQSWVTRGHHWGQVKSSSGSARSGEFGPISKLNLRILLRDAPQGHAARPNAGERFVDGTRIYAIQAVHESDPGYLTCFAQEVDT